MTIGGGFNTVVCMSGLLVAELVVRGASVGALALILGLVLTSPAQRVRRLLGALFMFGTIAYVLLSANDALDMTFGLERFIKAFAVFNSVFVWWFAVSLFNDNYRLTWARASPLIVIAVLHAPFKVWQTAPGDLIEQILHSIVAVGLLGHGMWLALKHRADDLVDPRRKFRLVFPIAVGIVGIAIAFGENIDEFRGLPESITFVHAIALAALIFFFGFWLLSADAAFFAPDSFSDRTPQRSDSTAAAQATDGARAPTKDLPAYRRLMELMDAGVYREEGLTVTSLAQKVGVPEHHLRRLINQELGFRNFSAFVNERRVADAKAQLADRDRARDQIATIALDLGFGSLAPFNRAFKRETGLTPTEFRRQSMESG
ncbi:MAG: AraC family transcriptional regulator [Pseudomonadota bacterium]